MDHDDNDVQSQNFQLVGEDNHKFPSSLRLFSLLKFELDDHLQIHPRFDGLVEQESLLGIQDQVQNNWIEDFSPGDTALELRSSAVESCSISMQKNVWSEATSSESVEMLLNSVGEDDMANKRMDAIYSESHDGSKNASDHMTSSYSQDDSSQSKDEKAMGANPVPPRGQCEKDLPRVNEDANAVLPDVPDMPNTFNNEESESRIFGTLDEVSKVEKANNPRTEIAEKCGLNESFNSPLVESFVLKEKMLDNSCSEMSNGGKSNDVFLKMNGSNDQAVSASFVALEIKDAFMMEVDPVAPSITIVANDVDEFPAQKFDKHVSESYGDEVFPVTSQAVEDGDHRVGGPTLMQASGLATQSSERCTTENSSDSPENPSNLGPKFESPALLMEGYNERGASEEDGLSDHAACQIKIFTGGNGITAQISTVAYKESHLVTKTLENIGHSVEVSKGDNIQSAFVDSLEQAKNVSNIASVESKISLKDHLMHDENLTEEAGDCEGRQLKEPATTEDKKDACNQPAENKKLAGLCTSSKTNCEMREADKEDSSLEIHPPRLTFQDPQSLEIQNCSGDEHTENGEMILHDTVNGPREVLQEVEHSPDLCVEHSDNTQISRSQGARTLEKCDTTVELDGRSSHVQSTPFLPKKLCSVSPASSDSPNVHTAMESLQDLDTLPERRGTSVHIPAAHVKGPPGRVITQVESGVLVDVKEKTPQSVGLPRSSSEPCSLEVGDCRPSPFEPSCGSPVVINCTEPSDDELCQQELKKGLSDSSVPLSGNLPQVSTFNMGSEDNKSTACDIKESNASKEGRSFTAEVGSLPDTARSESAVQGKLSSNMQSYELVQGGEGYQTTSGLRKGDLKVFKESPAEIHPQAEVSKKRTRKDKSKTVSCSVSERSTVLKRKSVRESLSVNQANERNRNPCTTPANKVNTVSRSMQLEEMQQPACGEGGSVKPSCALPVQVVKLPDSNHAVASFHQPFTDKQQVQLRAQIFVYGSLIQGLPPDEACMTSAFGDTDVAQSTWEGVWRIAIERFHSQRSTTHCVTLPHSHSGVGVHEQISRSNSLQNKTHGVSLSQTSKGAPPVIFNSPVSLPPLLCVSAPRDVHQSHVTKGPLLDSNQTFSPLHVSQSSHGKQSAGNGNPLLSQVPQVSPIPLIASPQTSMLDGGGHFSKLPLAETFHVTPIRNMSLPYCSNLQFKMPSPSTTSAVPLTPPAATTVQVEPTKKTEISGPEKHATNNQKTRRKKSVVPEVPSHFLPHSQPPSEPDSTTAATRHPPTMITMPTVSPVVPSVHFPVISSHVNEQKSVTPEETCSKTVQAKLQAEDAAAVAATAVRQSEGIWSQLSAQKNSGLISEMEMKLAYAAVAAAAASSIAKAAAAAAKVASDAALQAKLMSDETLTSKRQCSTQQHSETVHTGGGTYFTGVTPTLVLKGKDETSNSSSLIVAAKEAARRRMEAASAAAKHAENLDMIVKAAELAAVAVSQAGAIIAMGEPLPFTLSDLTEVGPEGYRRVQHSITGMHKEKLMDLDCADGLNNSLPHLHNTSLNEKHTQKVTVEGGRSYSAQERKQSIESQSGAVALPPFDISAPESEKYQTVANPKEFIIQEGSIVEVLSNENGLRRVWYSANVLNLKDGKAYVCYNNHPNAGSDKLKEWISLEGEWDKPPRIRIAHPITAVKYEGTRKRRRAAIGNYVWAIGDRVDAWIHDGWCEGIVTEKSKDDETKLTVHFPAGGDTSVVSVWHLRPSLIWKDGQWVEWSRPSENILLPHEGGPPQDKRRKLTRIETKNHNEVMNIGVDKHPANLMIDESRKAEESRPLVLPEKDKIFSLGKSAGDECNSDTLRIKRTGLQKEGSRVIFGIPKPGKKKKFMEVSKHYVKEKSDNATEVSDSIKFAKAFVPQSSRGWKNTKADPKGRRGGELNPKVVRSIKSQSMQTRSAAEREGSILSTMSTSNGAGTASHGENSEKNLLEAASVSNSFEAEENRYESHQCPVSGIASSKKKMNFAAESDVGTKGRLGPSLEKANNEEKHSYLADYLGKTVPDAAEPRRSSRRIQPTSRLLEGLQSSMVTAKIPSISHEKGSRSLHRNAPTS